MEQEFLPYDESTALKVVGFNEVCMAWYAENRNLQIAPDVYKKWTSKPLNNEGIVKSLNQDCVAAPTYRQVFQWFAEKTGIDYRTHITRTINKGFLLKSQFEDKYFDTYEEAELAAVNMIITELFLKK